MSERDGFFDDAFDVREYDPLTTERIGELEVAYVAGRHYVPAWGVSLTGPGGLRIVYGGDTGPNPALVAAAHDVDLLVCEATLGTTTDDDPVVRGHLTLDEALEHGRAARARRVMITHYPSARRESMIARLAELDGAVTLARPDLSVDVGPGDDAAVRDRSGADGRSAVQGPRSVTTGH